MKLYDLKKVLFITLLAFTSSVQLQAMSLQKLLLIMICCSPVSKEMVSQTVRDQYRTKIRYIIQGDDITWERLAMLPDGALVVQYPSLKLSAEMRNKNHFGTECPATESL